MRCSSRRTTEEGERASESTPQGSTASLATDDSNAVLDYERDGQTPAGATQQSQPRGIPPASHRGGHRAGLDLPTDLIQAAGAPHSPLPGSKRPTTPTATSNPTGYASLTRQQRQQPQGELLSRHCFNGASCRWLRVGACRFRHGPADHHEAPWRRTMAMHCNMRLTPSKQTKFTY